MLKAAIEKIQNMATHTIHKSEVDGKEFVVTPDGDYREIRVVTYSRSKTAKAE